MFFRLPYCAFHYVFPLINVTLFAFFGFLILQTPALIHQIQDCTFSRVTMLRVGGLGLRISAGVRDFPLQQKARTDTWAHPDYCSVCTGVLSRGQNGRALTLKSYFYLVPTLGTTRTVRLLPLYALTACTDTTIPLSNYLNSTHSNFIDLQATCTCKAFISILGFHLQL
jgi:hypothetical protein